MSHDATNWAIKVRGLKPIARVVLWHLADCHNPSMGCFPSQEYLAENCEIARSSVNRILDELEQRQLIRRVSRVHALTKKQLPTRYFLACEKDFHAQHVASRVSGSDTALLPPPEAEPDEQVGGEAGENSESRVSKTGGAVSHSSGTLTFKEPSTPLTPLTIIELVASWPDDKRDEQSNIVRAFDRLDAAEQREAIETSEAYRGGCYSLGRQLPRLSTYLRQKLWREFVNAPTIKNGRFRIERGSAEWMAWYAHFQAIEGPNFMASLERQGFVLVTERYPAQPRTPQSKPVEEDA